MSTQPLLSTPNDRVPLWHADVVTLFDPSAPWQVPLFLLAVVDPETARIWMRAYSSTGAVAWCDLLRRALAEPPLPRRLVVDRAIGVVHPHLQQLLQAHDVLLDWGWSEREVRDALRITAVERTLRRLVQNLMPTLYGAADVDALNRALDDTVRAL